MVTGLLCSGTIITCLCFLLLSCSWPVISHTNITHLPGFQGPLPFHLETGYISVGDLNKDQMFYYFLESESNPKEDPLLLWLTGGPGCTSFSALIFEIGPLRFDMVEYDGTTPKLVLNPYSWTKAASIIFPDQPPGTGFSYAIESDNYKTGDTKSTKEAYHFLLKWLMDHPQFLSNPIYVGGDSYSGMTVPLVVKEIADGIKMGESPALNLKGYILGNPATDPKFDGNGLIPHAYGLGLISDELYESAKKNCEGEYVQTKNPQCAMDLEAAFKCLSGLNLAHILEPACVYLSPKLLTGMSRTLQQSSKDFQLPQPLPEFGCRTYGYLLSYYWANDESVRSALHIRKGTVTSWERCSSSLIYTKDIISVLGYHLNLTSEGYRALVYSGDHDLMIPFVSTQAWIRSLNFSIVEDWRSWIVDNQVAGYTRRYSNNLTFATIKGGGHTAPEYKPKECSAMFQRWISHDPL